MRALILRRVRLAQSGAGGPVLIGATTSADVIRLEGFLSRNTYPHQLLDPATDHEASELITHPPAFAGTFASRCLSQWRGSQQPVRNRAGAGDRDDRRAAPEFCL
jgi:hypothetical protein